MDPEQEKENMWNLQVSSSLLHISLAQIVRKMPSRNAIFYDVWRYTAITEIMGLKTNVF